MAIHIRIRIYLRKTVLRFFQITKSATNLRFGILTHLRSMCIGMTRLRAIQMAFIGSHENSILSLTDAKAIMMQDMRSHGEIYAIKT